MEKIRIDKINTNNPFVVVHFGENEFLKKSIEKFGILSPPVLFRYGDSFEIIDGWERLKVAKKLSIDEIECRIIDSSLKESFVLHIVLNITGRGFSEGEKILIFNKFKTFGFSESETIDTWERVSGERISREFLLECFELYNGIEEIPQLIHRGLVNLTFARGILQFPSEWRKPIVSFMSKIRASTGESIRFLRLLEDGFYSKRIEGVDWLENYSDLKSVLEKIFSDSHPYTSRCREEIKNILSELPEGFEVKLSEFLDENDAELRIKFNIIEGVKIPDSLNNIILKLKKVIVEGVETYKK